jgi:type II secretory pathway component GspD/PulD (secretin)
MRQVFWMLFLVVGFALGASFPVVSADFGPNPVPLDIAIRTLAGGAGYGVIVQMENPPKVVIRNFKLPLDNAMELLSAFFPKEYSYQIDPKQKIVIVGPKDSLSALALKTTPPPPPPPPPPSSMPENTLPEKEEMVVFTYEMPKGVDLSGVSKIYPDVTIVSTTAGESTLLILRMPARLKPEVISLLDSLKKGATSKDSSSEPQQALTSYPLPKGVSENALKGLLDSLKVKGYALLPEVGKILCYDTKESCAKIGEALSYLSPEEKKAQVFTWVYPLYQANPEVVAKSLEPLLSRYQNAFIKAIPTPPSLLVSGEADLHKEIFKLIEGLDPSSSLKEVVRVAYKPRWKPAQKLASELALSYPELKITVSDESLVAVVPKEGEERLKSLLKDLDVPLKQVIYRVAIYEVKEQALRDFGLNLQSLLGKALEAAISGNGLNLGLVLPPEGTDKLLAGLKASQNALQGKFITDVSLAVPEEGEGKLQDGGRLVLLPSQGQSQQGGASPQQVQQAGGATSPMDIEWGLILKVRTSRVSAGVVSADVTLEMSEKPIVSTGAGNMGSVEYPKRSVEGSYILPIGGTLLMGWVLRDSATESRGGVPILSDIPILGALFGDSHTDKGGQRLIILITPTSVEAPSTSDTDFHSRYVATPEPLRERRVPFSENAPTGETETPRPPLPEVPLPPSLETKSILPLPKVTESLSFKAGKNYLYAVLPGGDGVEGIYPVLEGGYLSKSLYLGTVGNMVFFRPYAGASAYLMQTKGKWYLLKRGE